MAAGNNWKARTEGERRVRWLSFSFFFPEGRVSGMPVARPEPQEPRVIAHVDMDCFYVQGT